MDTSTILPLVKNRLGITTNIRDNYLTAIIDGLVKELEDEKGLVLDSSNSYHLMFVVDFATWRYQNRDNDSGIPRHLQFRLHNLLIHVGSSNLKVEGIETVAVLPSSPETSTVYILSDGSKQMYINGVWTIVDLVNGSWVVAA